MPSLSLLMPAMPNCTTSCRSSGTRRKGANWRAISATGPVYPRFRSRVWPRTCQIARLTTRRGGGLRAPRSGHVQRGVARSRRDERIRPRTSTDASGGRAERASLRTDRDRQCQRIDGVRSIGAPGIAVEQASAPCASPTAIVWSSRTAKPLVLPSRGRSRVIARVRAGRLLFDGLAVLRYTW